MPLHMVLVLLLAVVVAGCSDSSGGESYDYVEVTFDGESCNVEPDRVPAGDRGFVLTNDSEDRVSLYGEYR